MSLLASFFARIGFIGAALVSGWLLLNIAAIFEIGQALGKSKWKAKLFLVLVFPFAALLVFLYTMIAIIFGLLDSKRRVAETNGNGSNSGFALKQYKPINLASKANFKRLHEKGGEPL